MMNRIVVLAFMVVFPFLGFSQTILQCEECDTINIDECYIVKNGVKIDIDTNIHESVDGRFEILNYVPIENGYTMFAVAHTETIYTIYDSTIVNKKKVYSVDTSFSTEVYKVLVGNKEKLYNSLTRIAERSQSIAVRDKRRKAPHKSLRLISYYNKVKPPHINWDMADDNGLLFTETCDHCYVIIVNGRMLKTHDCPLYNNLYRLN